MVNVKDFSGVNDSQIIQKAINQRDADGVVIIGPRECETESDRKTWILDSAILLPENTTVILQNCKLKLSDKCRDNFFRSANCGMGIEEPEKIRNIHIKGMGVCVLEGADNPRATGDGGKVLRNPCPHLIEDACRVADWISEERRTPETIKFEDIHEYSYGTDAGNPDESQYGDWRGIGVLLANVEDFSISNIRIVKSHGWGISLEACSNGTVEKIDFDSCMYKEIDGMLMNMENQDGIDVRNGCHHIVISDITGCTGDDVIALTAIANPSKGYVPGGSLRSTHVMHNDWTRREKNIHDIIIRNVIARSYLCWIVRLLPAMTSIYNVVIDGIIDTAPDCNSNFGTILLGDWGLYGENLKDSMRNVTISNVICNSKTAITIDGFMIDSVITNVINKNPKCPAIRASRKDGLNQVETLNIVTKEA